MSDRRVPAAIIVAALLVGAALMMPMAPGGNSEPVDPKEGSVTTPQPTATPDQQPSLDRERPELEQTRLSSIPESHATATASDGPPVPDSVSASAGAQTMRVSTTTVDGEPALQLSDDSRHDGRWVSIETAWLEDNLGSVPDTVTVAHESNGTYVSELRVRQDSAAFYVSEFSTNTVTFGGEVSATGTYTDGSSFSYDISSLDSASEFTIDATGVTASEWDNETATGLTSGDVLDLAIAGTQVTDQSITLTGEATTTSTSASGVDGDTLSVGGNDDATGTVSLNGDGSITENDQTATSVSDGDTQTISNTGNLAPAGPSANNLPVLEVTGGTVERLNADYGGDSGQRSFAYAGQTISFAVSNPPSHITGLSFPVADSYLDVSGVDVYVDCGPADAATDGTLVTSNWNPDESASTATLTWDTPVDCSGASTVDITTVTPASDLANIGVSHTYGSGTYIGDDGSSESRALEVSLLGVPGSVTATASDGTTASFGTVGAGETKTAEFPVSASVSDISYSMDSSVLSSVALKKSDVTGVEDPSATIDGTTYSATGVYRSGETATIDVSIGPGTHTVSTSSASGPTPTWSTTLNERTITENPTVTLPDGTVLASYTGLLEPGETTTAQLDGALSTSTDSLDIVTDSGTVGVGANFRETAPTQDLTLSINGDTVSHSGTIADGETVSLNADTAWLQSGTNTVDVSLASASSDAPTPQVALDYSHSLSDRVSVNYQGEAFSERYNVSRSYASDRSDATLTIPHADEVLSIRNLDYQVDGGGWQQMPEGAATLDNTTLRVNMSALAGEPIPESTTIDIRSTASKVQVDGAEISVLQPTAVGFDLNSRIRLESWSDGASIALGGTPQGSLVHYATDESYSEEDDYAVLNADGSQRLYLPAATDGSELSIKTLPVEASPETNTMEVRVPDAANASNIEMVVSGGPVVGDSWKARYVGGTEGSYYAVVGENGDRLARAQAPDAMTVSRDDVGQVSIESAQPPSEDEPATAGAALFSTLGGPTFVPLLVIFGGIGAIGLAGRRPEQSRDTIAGLAGSVGGLISAVPRIGPAIASPVEDLITGIGDAAVSIGESEIAVGGIAVIATVAAEQANLFSVGPQVAAIGAIGAVAVGSLIALRRTDSFSIQLWGGIVGATTLVALQTLGETDLIGAVVNSDAFLFVALGGLYLAYRGISAWQASEQAENAPPEITIDASSFRGGDGGDDK